jgi:hypothetical protein
VRLTDLSPLAKALSRRTAALLTAGVIVVLAGAGCSSTDEGTVEVHVRVSVVCPKAIESEGCPMLGLPDADVTVSAGAGQVLASGKTDEAGKISLEVDQFGDLRVVARSPLLQHEAIGTVQLSPGGAGTVPFGVPMSSDVTTVQP